MAMTFRQGRAVYIFLWTEGLMARSRRHSMYTRGIRPQRAGVMRTGGWNGAKAWGTRRAGARRAAPPPQQGRPVHEGPHGRRTPFGGLGDDGASHAVAHEDAGLRRLVEDLADAGGVGPERDVANGRAVPAVTGQVGGQHAMPCPREQGHHPLPAPSPVPGPVDQQVGAHVSSPPWRAVATRVTRVRPNMNVVLTPLTRAERPPALAVGAPTSWGDYSPLMSGNRGRLDRIRAGSSWWLPAPESLGPSPPSDCPRPTEGRPTRHS